MKKSVKRNWLAIAGVIAGAISGYCYWQYVGCSSGTCAITSKPVNSTLYGAVLGGLVGSLFHSNKNKGV